VAVSGGVIPKVILGLFEVTVIETSVGGKTVRVTAGEARTPSMATTRVLPVATEVANPFEPAPLLIVATDPVADAQITRVVRS
jgi:hypothetical protein